MKAIIDLATQGAIEMKALPKLHIEAIEKAKTELLKAVKTLAGYGIEECRVIQSTKDPKLLHRATIKELIA